MRKFKIAIVERGKEALWRDYWINSGSKGGVVEHLTTPRPVQKRWGLPCV